MALRVTESKSMETPKSSRKVQISRKVQARRNDRISTIWLGIAAFSAPAIWIGHALLRHMHVL